MNIQSIIILLIVVFVFLKVCLYVFKGSKNSTGCSGCCSSCRSSCDVKNNDK
ncbi:MAG: hypothetical protein PUE01_00025 [Clostridiaceae bacterium]|nr:hypothetical protein [Clostridiaceae bacterium]